MTVRFLRKQILSGLTILLTGVTTPSWALDDVHVQVAETQTLKLAADLGAPPTFKRLRNISAGCDVDLGDVGESQLIGIAITKEWKVVQILSLAMKHKGQSCPLIFGRIKSEGEDAPFVLLGDTATHADGGVTVSYGRYGDQPEAQIRTLARVVVELGPALPAFLLPLHLEPPAVR